MKILNDKLGVAYSTTGSKVLDLFATIGSVSREPTILETNEICARMINAFEEDPIKTAVVLFWLRDARNGVGHRELFRILFTTYLTVLTKRSGVHPTSVSNLTGMILSLPIYGRFDDLIYVMRSLDGDTAMREIVNNSIDFLAITLNSVMTDTEPDFSSFTSDTRFDTLIQMYAEYRPLLGKWLPSINTSSRKTVNLAKWLVNKLRKSKYLPDNFNDKMYRKLCSKLRKQADIVEHHITTKHYSDIKYSAVPSLAHMKYSNAFRNNDGERYDQYLTDVKNGNAKINTSTLNIVDLVKKAVNGEDCEILWENLPKIPCNSLVCMDGSGSMYCGSGRISPIDVATALTIYCAEHNTAFKNQFITFGSNVQFVTIEATSFKEKIYSVRQHDDCGTTNFTAVFEELLTQAKMYHLSPDQMIKSIIVVSDMQFDSAFDNVDTDGPTVWENIVDMYEKAGYTPPKMIFWNVSSEPALPICLDNINTTITSGWSQNTLKYIMEDKEISPMSVLNEVLQSPNYSDVYKWFN